MSQKQGVVTCQERMTDFRSKNFFECHWAPGSTFKDMLVIIRENKWTLELISSFSRPGLVKFNKIYIEKVNKEVLYVSITLNQQKRLWLSIKQSSKLNFETTV